MKNKLSINENKVLDYLYSHEGLTTYQAVTILGILNVQDVLRRLKKYGNNIDKIWKTSINKKRYAFYYLIKSNINN